MGQHMTEVIFEETSGDERVERLPLAHLSIEIGHLYMQDLKGGPDRLQQLLEAVAPWVHTVRDGCARQLRPTTARVSTCFLVDDYFVDEEFTRVSSPRVVLPQIIEATRAAGLPVDYLAREAACVRADGVELARLVHDRLVPDPPPGTNGSRPPVTATGWLCNGERSPQPEVNAAMRRTPWRPPSENGANRHSIFVDVQLWEDRDDGRVWSCPYLAAVWQLLRLGVLRNGGKPVAVPQAWDG